MEDFTITTRLSKREYRNVLFILFYKHPYIICITILGLFFIVAAIKDSSNVIDFMWEGFSGIFLLFIPLLKIFRQVSQFASNRGIQEDISYTFCEGGIVAKGLDFKSEFSWAHIIKCKEIKNFLILYQTKKSGHYIDRTKLTEGQLKFIKSKVR